MRHKNELGIIGKIKPSVLLLLFALNNYCFSQTYTFKNFGIDEGISHPFVYDINQDKNGYLWASTGEGLCKFDGTIFKTFFIKDGLSENFVSKSYKDKKQRLWFGHKQGGITFLENDSLISIKTKGILNSLVNDFAEDVEGNIWGLSQNSGIVMVTKEKNLILSCIIP